MPGTTDLSESLDPEWVASVERVSSRPFVAMAYDTGITRWDRCALCREAFRTTRGNADAVLVVLHERGEDYLHRRCVESTLSLSALIDEDRAADELAAFRERLLQG